MPTLESLLPGALLPACAAGFLLALGWRAWRRDGPDGRWIGGLALGVAFFLGFVLVASFPALPFGERRWTAQERLAWLVLAGGALFVLEPRLKRGALVLRILFAAALLVALLPARIWTQWDALAIEHLELGLALGFLVVWGATESLARRARGASIPAALFVAGSALSLVLGLTGSAVLGQLGGALTGAIGAALVLALWRPSFTLAGPGLAIWAALHCGLALCGYFYSYTPPLDALLVGLAPLAAWCAEIPSVRRRPAWQVAFVGALAVAVPAGVAVTRAVLAFDPDPYGSY